MNSTARRGMGAVSVELALVLCLIGLSVCCSISTLCEEVKAPYETLAGVLDETKKPDAEIAPIIRVQESDDQSSMIAWGLPVCFGLVGLCLFSLKRQGRDSARQEIVNELQAIIDDTSPSSSSAALSKKREAVLNAMMVNAACPDRKTLTAGEVMSTNISYVLPDTAISRVRKQMKKQGIHHLMVCSGSGLVGVISDRDFPNKEARTAEDLMTKNPLTVDSGSDVTEITNLMLHNRISCVPVVEGRKVVGVVTSTDISVVLQCILKLFGNLLWVSGKAN